jgi:hypothetical protein
LGHLQLRDGRLDGERQRLDLVWALGVTAFHSTRELLQGTYCLLLQSRIKSGPCK